jgi:hypothetical protein
VGLRSEGLIVRWSCLTRDLEHEPSVLNLFKNLARPEASLYILMESTFLECFEGLVHRCQWLLGFGRSADDVLVKWLLILWCNKVEVVFVVSGS